MRKILIPLAIVSFIFIGGGPLASQQSPEDAKFQKMQDTFFDELWKFYPTAATMAGVYKYNDKLDDLSSKNIERRHEQLDQFNGEIVAKMAKDKLSPDRQTEHEIMIDAIDLEFVKFESLLPWEYNPLYYNEILLHSIRGVLIKDFAPIDVRIKSATLRAKAIPDLIKQAKENLKTPPQQYTETAIKQFPGIIAFYRTEVPQLVDQASANLKSVFQAELAKALTALEDYQNYLQNTLLSKSTGNFRLGDQTHVRLLRLTAQNSIPLQDIIAQAKADYNNIRREMFLVCIPFYRIMYPNINLEQLTTQRGEEEVRTIVIKGVFDKIKNEHPTKEEYFNRIKMSADEIKSFISQNKLIDLPEEDLAIELMPPAMRGTVWSRLVGPGPYENGGPFTCLVMPIPDDWPPDAVNSYLEDYTDYYLYFWTIEKVFPGSFVPAYFTRKDPSLVKKIYPSQPLLKAWPLYTEEMLIHAGFGNYDLRLRLNQLKLQLKAVIDFNLELNIHQGSMAKEQAIAYMTKGGFQTQAEAERKWNYISLNPGESAHAYIGFQEILAFEKEYKKLKGEAFSQKEFLQKLLSYGALPLRTLKTKISQ